MLSWISFLIIALAVAFVVFVLPRLLPPRLTGKSYFKKQLWKNGVDWRPMQEDCIREFVDDALKYANSISTIPPVPDIPKGDFYSEFERMLRIHAFVAAALLRGEKKAEICELETQKSKDTVAAVITAALLKGMKEPELSKLAAKKTKLGITDEAVDAALLRKKVSIFDFESRETIEADVKSGKEWDLQEAILKKYGLLC